MDGTANDLPADAGFEVAGFPTIVLVKAGSNQVVTYEGDRSLGDMVKFLKENVSNPSEINEEVLSKEDEEDPIDRDEL